MPALFAAWLQTQRFLRPSSPGFPAAAGERNTVRARQSGVAPATKMTLLKVHGQRQGGRPGQLGFAQGGLGKHNPPTLAQGLSSGTPSSTACTQDWLTHVLVGVNHPERRPTMGSNTPRSFSGASSACIQAGGLTVQPPVFHPAYLRHLSRWHKKHSLHASMHRHRPVVPLAIPDTALSQYGLHITPVKDVDRYAAIWGAV